MTLLSPRAIHYELARLLSIGEALLLSSEPHDNLDGDTEKTLCEKMWDETKEERERALNTDFVQDIKMGKLDPVVFGGYIVQDAVFCEHSTQDLKTAAKKCEEGGLKQFLEGKATSYEKYSEEMFEKWHIENASGISLGDACQNYVDVLNNTAKSCDPIYLIVASIPCARLWPWIGKELNEGVPDFGCYSNWVSENFDAKSDGYITYELIVNKYPNLDKVKAKKIYQDCMKGEADFFASA